MKILLFSFIGFSLLINCTSRGPKDPGPHSQSTAGVVKESQVESIESKQMAAAEETDLVTEVTFAKNSSIVSETAQKEIKKLFSKANKRGEIEKVKVVTWGDKEFPSNEDQKLSEAQQKLVEKRNTNLEKYLNTFNKGFEIEAVSMAERGGGRDLSSEKKESEELDTKEGAVEEAQVPTTDSASKFAGKASRAVIMFIPKET